MKKGLFLITALALISGCGKNDNFRSVGGYNYNTPYTPSYPYGQTPQPGPYTVQWQVPQNMPPQFQPFAPMYNYMQQNYQMQQYWQYMWYQWQLYASQCNCPTYDFQVFWNDFCPQFWSGNSSYTQVYQWYDQNVYYYY